MVETGQAPSEQSSESSVSENPERITAIDYGFGGFAEHRILSKGMWWPAQSLELHFYLEKAGVHIDPFFGSASERNQMAIKYLAEEFDLMSLVEQNTKFKTPLRIQRQIQDHLIGKLHPEVPIIPTDQSNEQQGVASSSSNV